MVVHLGRVVGAVAAALGPVQQAVQKPRAEARVVRRRRLKQRRRVGNPMKYHESAEWKNHKRYCCQRELANKTPCLVCPSRLCFAFAFGLILQCAREEPFVPGFYVSRSGLNLRSIYF